MPFPPRGRKKRGTVNFTVRLPERINDQLCDWAEAESKDKSVIVREALNLWFRAQGASLTLPPPQSPKKRSVGKEVVPFPVKEYMPIDYANIGRADSTIL